jgi:hypothetical protein
MEFFSVFLVNIVNLVLYFQEPKHSDILGFHNFQAALNAHYSDSDAGSGSGAVFNVRSSQKRPGRHIPPSPTPSIPDSVSDEGSAPAITRNSSELGGDADDEIDEEEDCSEDEEDIPRKPGKRYTRLDFEFLQEDWLDTVDGSSEDISTCSD